MTRISARTTTKRGGGSTLTGPGRGDGGPAGSVRKTSRFADRRVSSSRIPVHRGVSARAVARCVRRLRQTRASIYPWVPAGRRRGL